MRKAFLYLICSIMIFGCNSERKLKEIIDCTHQKVDSLSTAANLAYWNATTSGNEADFQKYTELSMKLNQIYSDKETFSVLKKLKKRNNIKNDLLKRELDILYNTYLGNQADTALLNKILLKETELEQKYASFRAEYKGNKINDNQVEEILHQSTNNSDLQSAWEAHKAIGPLVAKDIIEVVKLRNELARTLGFENYHSMSMMLTEEDPEEISRLFDELDEMTRDGFAKVKAQMDTEFSKRYGIPADKLMPWHFQGRFFQEAPNLYPVDLDKYYSDKNLEKLTAQYYESIGLNVNPIMDHSDLYPRDGKNQHAFCTDINREGDIRVLCNIVPNENWMGTMLHEFGHGVYAQGHDAAGNPYFLRDAANSFTTEAVAMLFERNSRNPEWMQVMLGISDEEKNAISEECAKASRLKQLVFSRWVQVVYRFEKALYADPDQDLNRLWWDLVKKYQLVNCPEGRNEPDWATKIHIALYPCYYHNYQLGELFASQMHYYIINNITKSGDKNDCYYGKPEVGSWMQEYVFNPGMKYGWDDMIERATGEKLTPKYYKMQFVD